MAKIANIPKIHPTFFIELSKLRHPTGFSFYLLAQKNISVKNSALVLRRGGFAFPRDCAIIALMFQARLAALLFLIAGTAIGFYVFAPDKAADLAENDAQKKQETPYGFTFGLDLVGGSHLIYEADTSKIAASDEAGALEALRNVVERRVNVFGVAEPLVQVEETSSFSSSENSHRLIVELPGVTDLNAAVAMIGQTPLLEFKLVKNPQATSSEERYEDTGLTGALLSHAALQFGSSQVGVPNEPTVLVTFNSEGATLFSNITTAHTREQLAIFLDGRSISEPVINEPITGGTAVISGNFTPEEAKELVRNLNIGALPVPIMLVGTNTVGASLGADTLNRGVKAGLIGLLLVGIFMALWYRLPGLVATLALGGYIIAMLALFKSIPVTLTAAGIAGFILSIGMAVDANVLIFERTKEELRGGKGVREALREGFSRAWPSIRDGHLTCLISAAVLFWFGTSLVQGFALVYGIGILMSLFTAIVITRTLLSAFGELGGGSFARFLFSAGLASGRAHPTS